MTINLPSPDSKTALFLRTAVANSPHTHAEIAKRAGLPNANLVSMYQTGSTKMPIGRVISIARSLEVDPVQLYRLAMEEYNPDVLKMTDEIYRRDELKAGERLLIERIRLHTYGEDFQVSDVLLTQIDALMKGVVKR